MVIKNSTPWSTDDLRKLYRRCSKEVDKVERPNTPFHKRNKHYNLDILNSNTGLRGRASLAGYWAMIKIPATWFYKTELPTKPDDVDKENGYNVYYHITQKHRDYVTDKFVRRSVRIPISKNQVEALNSYPENWAVIGEIDELTLKQKTDLARLMIHEYYHNLGTRQQDRRGYKCDWTKKWNVDWVKDYPIRKKQIPVKEKVDIKLQRYQRAIENLRHAETKMKRAKTSVKKWSSKVKYYLVVCNKSNN